MKKNSFTKLFAVILCLAMMMTLLAGCGGNEPADEGSTEVRDTLVVASQTEPTSLGTTYHNALASDYVNQLIYAGLVRVDENADVVPDVAESWEQVSDTEWIFHIRQDAYFHNGEQVTAHDVVATLIWAQDFEPVSSLTLTFAETIEATDDFTVRIVTKSPQAALLYNLSNHANFIVPKSLIESGNDFNENPIGCGPYKFVSWDASEKLTFEAFEDFYEGAPAMKKLVYMVIPETANRTVALQSGDVDYVIQVSTADYELLLADENIETLEMESCGLNYMMLNNGAAPFNDVNFRKAVNAAINKEEIVEAVFNGLATPALAQCPDTLPGAVTTNAVTYDPAKSLEYLEAWGGSAEEATFTVLCSNDTKVKVAELIQAYLNEVGITMNIETCDTAAYLARCAAGDYQAAIGGYNHSSMFTFANYNYLSEESGGSPNSHACYPEVDALLAECAATVEPTAHVEKLEELCALLNDTCINVPLYLDLNLRAYNKDLENIIINSANENNLRTICWAN